MQSGEYTILVRDFSAGSGTFTLNVQPPLYVDTIGATSTPRGLGRDGDLIALFASLLQTPPTVVLPGLSTGFLLIDLNTLVLFSTQTAPLNGKFNWPVLPSGFGGYLQSVSFEGGGFPAGFSDRVKN